MGLGKRSHYMMGLGKRGQVYLKRENFPSQGSIENRGELKHFTNNLIPLSTSVHPLELLTPLQGC